MKKKATTTPYLAAFFLVFSLLFQFGCEDNNEDYSYDQDINISALQIRPSPVTLNADDSLVVLFAAGGTSPYYWTVRNESLGTIDTNNTSSVVYNRVGAEQGVNIVSLRDANNWTVEATITHTTNLPPDVTGTVTF